MKKNEIRMPLDGVWVYASKIYYVTNPVSVFLARYEAENDVLTRLRKELIYKKSWKKSDLGRGRGRPMARHLRHRRVAKFMFIK